MRKKWREWTPEERLKSQARAAYLFLNIVPCSDCGLPWAEGYIHIDCPEEKPSKKLAKISSPIF